MNHRHYHCDNCSGPIVMGIYQCDCMERMQKYADKAKEEQRRTEAMLKHSMPLILTKGQEETLKILGLESIKVAGHYVAGWWDSVTYNVPCFVIFGSGDDADLALRRASFPALATLK